jgi:hypothetical protein
VKKLLRCDSITNLQLYISSTWILYWFNYTKLQRWTHSYQTYIGLPCWHSVLIFCSCNIQKVGEWVDKSMLNELLANCGVSTQKISNVFFFVYGCQHELNIKCGWLAFWSCWHCIKSA